MRTAEGLKDSAASLGVLASSSGTIEELYLAARIARALGSHNIDHRLRQRDFRDQAADPVFPGLGMRIAEVDALQCAPVSARTCAGKRRSSPIVCARRRCAERRWRC